MQKGIIPIDRSDHQIIRSSILFSTLQLSPNGLQWFSYLLPVACCMHHHIVLDLYSSNMQPKYAT